MNISRFHSRSNYSRSPQFCQQFYQADDGTNIGGAGTNETQSSPPENSSQKTESDIASQVRSAVNEVLAAKSGDANAALETLIRRNHALEQRAENAEKQRISKADAELLAAVKSLELTPDAVQTIVRQHSEWGAERKPSRSNARHRSQV